MACKLLIVSVLFSLHFIQVSYAQGGVKTKTSSSSRYQPRFGSNQNEKETRRHDISTRLCDRPHPPDSGTMRCGMENDVYVCTGECLEGYSFPDGSQSFKLTCNNHNGHWQPYRSFLACERTPGADYEFIGGGGGMEHFGQQPIDVGFSNSHSDKYTDFSTVQQQRIESGNLSTGLCKPLQQPKNGRSQCTMSNGAWTCHISCMSGYNFPDGNSELTVICNDKVGKWSPKDTFDDCQSASGQSQDFTVFQQQEDEDIFGGSSRQYNIGGYGGSGIDLCPSLKQPMNARKQCSMSNGDWSCHISCMNGFKFPDGNSELTVTCNSKVGKWSPKETFEDCKSTSGGNTGFTIIQQQTEQEDHNAFRSSSSRYNTGGFGSQDRDLCPTLRQPMNGRKQCSMSNGDWTCYVACMAGYKFPDGNTGLTLKCNNKVGKWSPTDTYEDCQSSTGASRGAAFNTHQDLCQPLKQPMNGGKQCSMSNGDWRCHITCMPGYQFPDGNTELTVSCSGRVGQWTPKDTFDDCKSISGGSQMTGYHQQQVSGGGSYSSFQQQGGGSYSSFNQQGGGSSSHGSYNQRNDQLKKSCADPVAPKNGFIHCSGFNGQRTCQVTCNPGYEFADRTRQININCYESSGRWSPKEDFGDCQLLCHPPCQNEGTCQVHNQCSCTSEFRGNRCQYAISLCDYQKFSSGTTTADCQHNPEYTECQVSCPPGSTFDPPTSSMYRCTVNGLWNPPMPPRCTSEKEELCKMPLSPDNGRIRCVTNSEVMQCSATCRPGYTFESGFQELSIQCVKRTGEWTPEIGFPNCQGKHIWKYTFTAFPQYFIHLYSFSNSLHQYSKTPPCDRAWRT